MSEARQKNQPALQGGNEVFYLFKGIALAFLLLPAALLPFCVLCRTFYASRTAVDLCAGAAFALSCFFAALCAAKNFSKSGLLRGAAIGFGFFLIMFCVSAAAKKAGAFSLFALSRGVLLVLGGAFGGIAGINSKKRSARR